MLRFIAFMVCLVTHVDIWYSLSSYFIVYTDNAPENLKFHPVHETTKHIIHLHLVHWFVCNSAPHKQINEASKHAACSFCSIHLIVAYCTEPSTHCFFLLNCNQACQVYVAVSVSFVIPAGSGLARFSCAFAVSSHSQWCWFCMCAHEVSEVFLLLVASVKSVITVAFMHCEA